MKLFSKPKKLLLLIFLISLTIRLYGLNWDQGNHLHPDERMIVMVADRINIPKTDIFSPDSSLNPKFFAYGSLPIYLLKFSALLLSPVFPKIVLYEQINLWGRVISAFFDSLSIFFIFLISYSIFKDTKKGLVASTIYAFSVLPIQLSHFYAVDTILSLFILITLYHSISYFQTKQFSHLIWTAIGFGLSLATKVSATVLLIPVLIGLVVSVILTVRNQHFSKNNSTLKKVFNFLWHFLNPGKYNLNRFKKIFSSITLLFVVFIVATTIFVVFEPFAYFDFKTFIQQILEQQAMTKDAFVFPYTLQYVYTLPYIYPLLNILLWGLGPVIGVLSIIGFFKIITKLISGLLTPGNDLSEGAQIIVFSFFLTYFFIVGGFAIKFMRYCLPLYPFLAIFAADVFTNLKSKFLKSTLVISHLLIVIAFISIYRIPNTRVTATEWINNNVPPGSTILVEHWDDPLPLGYFSSFNQLSLPLYDSDTDPAKWININNMLSSGDYLIIASNRLHTPLQKLTDCNKLPPGKCYPITAKYYQDLFSGKLNYQKVAEFTSYPNLFGISINDQSADESFTVYDHPKVMIFRKQR